MHHDFYVAYLEAAVLSLLEDRERKGEYGQFVGKNVFGDACSYTPDKIRKEIQRETHMVRSDS